MSERSVVQGLGGAFLYAQDVEGLAAWYSEHLGISFESWGESRGIPFPSADLEPSTRMASTTFAIMKAETPLPDVRGARINFRVSELSALVARLREAGCEVEESDDHSFGDFAWFVDPEGHRIELWQPPEDG